MIDLITTRDYPLLTSNGWKSQFAECIVWKDDNMGNHWQAQLGDSGEQPVVFIKHTKDYRRSPEELMTREQFVELFMKDAA